MQKVLSQLNCKDDVCISKKSGGYIVENTVAAKVIVLKLMLLKTYCDAKELWIWNVLNVYNVN